MKRVLAVFDVDYVLVNGETQNFLSRYLLCRGFMKAGMFLRIIWWFMGYRFGLIKDTYTIRQEAYTVFNGWTMDDMKTRMRDFFSSEIKGRLCKEMVCLVRDHIQKQHVVVILSASLEPLVACIADYLGVSGCMATRLLITEGYYTGTIEGEVPYGAHKASALKAFMEQSCEEFSQVFIYADHFSDRELLAMASDPVAINPDTNLRDLAIRKGWEIRDFL